MDGNDKLKPYGFSIHGCIDGYVISHSGLLHLIFQVTKPVHFLFLWILLCMQICNKSHAEPHILYWRYIKNDWSFLLVIVKNLLYYNSVITPPKA